MGHAAQISRQYPISGLKRVEVLYGPTSAVYGPNAFLGVINLITEDGKSLRNGETRLNISTQLGSYKSRGAEFNLQGKQGEWWFNLSGKAFHSNEAALSDLAPWGFLTNQQLNNKNTWGSVLGLDNAGVRYGEYFDPTENWGILGEAHFRNFTFGLIAWDTREGFGPYYSADRVQPNAYWKMNSHQYYLKHDYQANKELNIKSQILYRDNRLWGNWVEAVPDWNDNKSAYSYLSISDWNTQSHSWLFKQDYDYQYSKELRFTGGLKYDAKTLTKAYDVCSYWKEAFCSSDDNGGGAYGYGSGVFYSTDPTAMISSVPLK